MNFPVVLAEVETDDEHNFNHYTTEMYSMYTVEYGIIQDKVPHFFNAIFHL